MIKVQGLTKYYGTKPAAKDITFEVQKGEVFGLLGTNGAGKSTTIKMLCGLLKPTRGLIQIGDVDLNRKPLKAKSLMGYLPENPLIYDKLTGAETLELIGKLRKLSSEMIQQRVNYYAETLGLGEQIYHEVGTYSKGMRQKLAIAMTLIHDPEMILLHPGPVNFGIELSKEASELENCKIKNQIFNGVGMRMAVLTKLFSQA